MEVAVDVALAGRHCLRPIIVVARSARGRCIRVAISRQERRVAPAAYTVL